MSIQASDPTAKSTLASAPNIFATGSTASQALAANQTRKELILVNVGTVVVYVAFGVLPTTALYHVALSACGVAGDGTGGSFISDLWKGAVAVISSSAGSVSIVELS